MQRPASIDLLNATERAKLVHSLNFGRVFKRATSAVCSPAAICILHTTSLWKISRNICFSPSNILCRSQSPLAEPDIPTLDDAIELPSLNRDTPWLASRSTASRRQSPSTSRPRPKSAQAMRSRMSFGAKRHSRARQKPTKGTFKLGSSQELSACPFPPLADWLSHTDGRFSIHCS